MNRWLLVLVMGLIGVSPLAIGSSLLFAQGIVPEASEETQVSPYLSAQLEAGAEEVSILVLLRDQPDVAALSAAASATASSAASGADRHTARASYLYQELTAYAAQSQAELRAWLDAQGIPYRAHYIINMITVTGDAALVEALRQRPDVARLDANPQVDTMHMVAASTASWAHVLELPEAAASPNTPYGVSATRAPEVWAMGYTGQGIVVATQDTGVQWEHPALRPHYRGTISNTVDHTYNWLDAIPNTATPDGCAGLDTPCDDNGHGTHTVGTMLGMTDAITYGVAPGALWMGCRNMRGGVGTPDTYTTCFEFFMAPYPTGGDPFTDGRPEFAPHIINNSWGCPPSEGCNKDSLRQVVETVRAAGIMVVASAGNVGASGCSSVIDPIAIYDATFTVGAHDSGGNLAGFSSRGPVTADGSGRLKPDLTAPGVRVISTNRFSGTTTLSGTSMASPHVAGAVALLWSAAPWLVGNPDMTEQALLKSATPVTSTICNGLAGSPNPAFGYGRLDVAEAVNLALQPWEVTVVVTDAVGAPVAGVAVTWIDERTGYTNTATTGVSGTVRITPTLAGNYTIEVRGNGGTVEVSDLTLVNDGIGGEPQTEQFRVLYDADILLPAKLYLPHLTGD